MTLKTWKNQASITFAMVRVIMTTPKVISHSRINLCLDQFMLWIYSIMLKSSTNIIEELLFEVQG